MKILKFPVLILFILFVNTSCYEDNDDKTVSASQINDFVYRGMNQFYLYKDDVPVLANDRFSNNKEYAAYLNSFSKKTYASLSFQYTGERLDNGDITLESFNLFNLYVSHSALNNKIKFFAGIDNILNEDYLEISQYTTKGRNARLGFQLTL